MKISLNAHRLPMLTVGRYCLGLSPTWHKYGVYPMPSGHTWIELGCFTLVIWEEAI